MNLIPEPQNLASLQTQQLPSHKLFSADNSPILCAFAQFATHSFEMAIFQAASGTCSHKTQLSKRCVVRQTRCIGVNRCNYRRNGF